MKTFLTVPGASRRVVVVARPKGFALIATLALLVLLTFIMVLFFTRATSNRQIESAETANQEADLVARGALQAVIRDIRQEMLASSTSTATIPSVNGIPIYQPFVYESVVMNPYRVLAPGISSTDPNFYNLLKQSGTSYLFPTALPYNINASATPMIIGSTITTDKPSANGRTVSATRWSAPLLTGTNFTSSNQLPTWVLVTRSGIPANQAWTGTFANASQSNPSYVVGRFAFNIYDEGGLLDVNAAGYDGVGLTSAQAGSLKNTLLGTSLANIPGVLNASALVQWRNMASATTVSNFTTAAGEEATNAFLTPLSGDNQYLSRQDLINYAQANPTVLSTANPNALQYLTTFTREPNAPSWFPDYTPGSKNRYSSPTIYWPGNGNVQQNPCYYPAGTPIYSYALNANSPTVSGYPNPNRFIPNVRFTGISSTAPSPITDYNSYGSLNTYLTSVTAGQPLVQHRFSLDKLSWIGPNGPGTTTAGTTPSAAAIQACFGLVWNGSNAWKYVGPTGTTIQSSIETLDQIAAESTPRQPNFFELLKSGILVGSLGLNGGFGDGKQGASGQQFYTNPDVQILKIGADLIDQAGSASNPPTCIMFTLNPMYFGSGPNVNGIEPVIGSKSLPLINKFVLSAEDPQQNGMPTEEVYLWFEFEMWNPYAGASSITFPSTSPTLRIVYGGDSTGNDVTMPELPPAAAGGPQMSWFIYGTGGSGTSVPPPTAGQMITLSLGGCTDKMDEPIMLDKVCLDGASASSSGPYPTLDIYRGTLDTPNNPYPAGTTGYPDTATGFYVGEVGSYTGTYSNFQPASLDTGFYLQYYYPNSGWRTVQAFHELQDNSADQIQSNPSANNFQYIAYKHASYPFIDPRTDRFGVSEMDYRQGTVATGPNAGQGGPTGIYWGKSIFANPNDPTTQFYFQYPQGGAPLFGPSLSGPSGIPAMFRLADNSGPVAGPTFDPQNNGQAYADPDAIQRPGDGVWNDVNTSLGVYPLSTASLRLANYSGATVDPERPVMLNRPFQNVGEMAYAFRDLPFRSIDFNSQYSADAALMDLFCVGDDSLPFRAGRVDLNRASVPVLTALLNGANQDVLNGTYLSATAATNTAVALNTALQTYPAFSKGQYMEYLPTTGTGALTNTVSIIKSQREAVARSLIDVSQVRTWNLLVDIVAQAGRFSPLATSGDQFTVQGERRYWLHLAIDRYTGQVVDQQLEPVNE